MRSQLDSGSHKSFWSKSRGHLEQWWILIMRANGLSKFCFRMIFILCLLSVANGLGFRRKIDWIFQGDLSRLINIGDFTYELFFSLINVTFPFSTIMKWRNLDLLQSLLRKYNDVRSFDKYSIGTVNRHGANQFRTL